MRRVASFRCRGGIGLIALALFLAGCRSFEPSPAVSHVPGGRVEQKVILPAGGLPTFPAAGTTPEQPSLYIVDTGAYGVLVTPRMAEQSPGATLRRVRGLVATDALGNSREAERVARFESLDVAGATFGDFDAVVDDLRSLRENLSPTVDAVLGRSLFRDVLLTIDYPRGRLILEDGQLPPPDGQDVLPLVRGREGELLVPVSIGGVELLLLLDTGHTLTGLQFDAELIGHVPWASPPVAGPEFTAFYGTGRTMIGRIDRDAQIGKYTIRRPVVSVDVPADPASASRAKADGRGRGRRGAPAESSPRRREYIGADTLRHFVVTIDQRNDRIRFARPTDDPIDVPPVRTLGFGFEPQTGIVTTVAAGSGAEGAGLCVGDRLTLIVSVPPSQFTWWMYERLIRTGWPVPIQLERGSQRLSLSVPLTVVVP